MMNPTVVPPLRFRAQAWVASILALSLTVAAIATPLDPQEVLYRDKFSPKYQASDWGTENTPHVFAYHALAAIYGWKRHKLGRDFAGQFGTDAHRLKDAAIVAANKIAERAQSSGWASPSGSGWEEENGFQTGMAAWALAEVGGILLQYGTETTLANSYLDLADEKLEAFKDTGGFRCNATNGVNYDHNITEPNQWPDCGTSSNPCSYWSIFDPLSGTTCTSGRRYIKNRNLIMGVASLAYDRYRSSTLTHKERGIRSIRAHATEIGASGTANTDYYSKIDTNYLTRPWDDHNWAEAAWMLHAGRIISRFSTSMGDDREDRAFGHYVHMRNYSTDVEREARTGCHFSRRDSTAWTDCYNYNVNRTSISDPHAYGLVVDAEL